MSRTWSGRRRGRGGPWGRRRSRWDGRTRRGDDNVSWGLGGRSGWCRGRVSDPYRGRTLNWGSLSWNWRGNLSTGHNDATQGGESRGKGNKDNGNSSKSLLSVHSVSLS